MSSEQPDIYTRLLQDAAACPACGGAAQLDVERCPQCGRPLMAIVRPVERSHGVFALAGVWTIATLGSLLFAAGVLLRPPDAAAESSNFPWSVVMVVGCLVLGLFTSLMAWGSWTRRPFTLYVGTTLAALLVLGGVAAGLIVQGQGGLILVSLSVLLGSPVVITHLLLGREFLGERRRLTFDTRTTSAKGLYNEGRSFYDTGLYFVAAQRWARAVSKNPTEPAYLHAFGLALARLGYYEDALSQIERAIRMEPEEQQFRQSYTVIERMQGAAGERDQMTR